MQSEGLYFYYCFTRLRLVNVGGGFLFSHQLRRLEIYSDKS